jgi:hypothetical protein
MDDSMIYYLALRKWLFLNSKRGAYIDLPKEMRNEVYTVLGGDDMWHVMRSQALTRGYTSAPFDPSDSTIHVINLKGLWALHIHKHRISVFYKKWLC